MRTFFGYVLGILLAIGMLLIIGSIAYLILGPEQFAAFYERAAPALPYFLSGVGLIVLCVVVGNILWPNPPNPPDTGSSKMGTGACSDSEAGTRDGQDTGIRSADANVWDQLRSWMRW
jgi:hypothetical protein